MGKQAQFSVTSPADKLFGSFGIDPKANFSEYLSQRCHLIGCTSVFSIYNEKKYIPVVIMQRQEK